MTKEPHKKFAPFLKGIRGGNKRKFIYTILSKQHEFCEKQLKEKNKKGHSNNEG